TPGFLLLLLGSAALAIVHRRRDAIWRHWLVPAVVIFGTASIARVQLGERYILPVYAYLILWIASVLAPFLGDAPVRRLLAAALVAHVVSVIAVAPHGYLTYFNAIAGGPEGGYRWLADSNLDWGQDLPRLAHW